MPAAPSKVDVMIAKRAEHQRTIAAHHTNLAHSAAVHHSPYPADECPDSARDVDEGVAAAAQPQSQSCAQQGATSDVDTESRKTGSKQGSSAPKRSKRARAAAIVSEEGASGGDVGGSGGNALQHAWVPDIVGSGGTGRFRDENFFLSAEKPDRHAEEGYAVADQGRGALAANVLDLTGEDNAGMLAQRKRKVWDNKKKRYVTLQKVRSSPTSYIAF